MPNNIVGESSPSSTDVPATDEYQLAKYAAVGGFMFFMFVPAEEDPREYVPLADWLCYLPPYHGDPAYHYQEDHH